MKLSCVAFNLIESMRRFYTEINGFCIAIFELFLSENMVYEIDPHLIKKI